MKEIRGIKRMAEELKERGYTLNVIHDNKLIFRIGKEAKPGLLSLFGPIEIKDLKTTLKILNL